MNREFYGVLTKVFYSGNSNKTGGEYTLTFLDLKSKEEVIVYVKVRVKIEFDMKNQYVYKVIHDQGYIEDLFIVANSINEYLNNQIIEKPISFIHNKRQVMPLILHWTIVIIIFTIISYFLLEIIK